MRIPSPFNAHSPVAGLWIDGRSNLADRAEPAIDFCMAFAFPVKVVDIQQIGQDPCENLSGCGGDQMTGLKPEILSKHEHLTVLLGHDSSAVKGIKNHVFVPREEVAGQVDPINDHAGAKGHHAIKQREGNGDSHAGFNHMRQQGVSFAVVVFRVSAKTKGIRHKMGEGDHPLTAAHGLGDFQGKLTSPMLDFDQTGLKIHLRVQGMCGMPDGGFDVRRITEKAAEELKIKLHFAVSEQGENFRGVTGNIGVMTLGKFLKVSQIFFSAKQQLFTNEAYRIGIPIFEQFCHRIHLREHVSLINRFSQRRKRLIGICLADAPLFLLETGKKVPLTCWLRSGGLSLNFLEK